MSSHHRANGLKQWASTQVPRLYALAQRIYRSVLIEWKVVRQVGLRPRAKKRKGARWEETLPAQRPLRMVVEGSGWSNAVVLLEDLRTLGVRWEEGAHTIYLSPESVRATALQSVVSRYPPDTGLKILRNTGSDLEQSGYVHGPGHSRVQRGLMYTPEQMVLVGNLLAAEGLGPRIYDVLEYETGGTAWKAYAMEHIQGRPPTEDECNEVIGRLRQLAEQGVLKVIAPGGLNHPDFHCPECNGNIRVTEAGEAMYLDFQNFLLPEYDRYLERIAEAAARETHFGDRSLLRGGSYLYQTVPTTSMPAKRDIDARWTVISGMLKAGGVSLADRLVLDVGCNIGVMMSRYLMSGAYWCHGWDLPALTTHTQRILMALGCTRFSLTGGALTPERRLMDDLPPFLEPFTKGCVISYLAIRGHVGWLDILKQIPWSFLIYEGHEGESEADTSSHFQELRTLVDFEVASVERYQDGDSDPRFVALLKRMAA